MIIDILFLILIIVAIIKGIQRGLIIAVFSLIALIIGLAAALKLSTVVAGYLQDSVNVSAKWLPLVSFALVFIVVVWLVRWASRLLQNTVELVWLGWVNKLGGAVFYGILYIIIFSIVLFFVVHMKLVSEATLAESKTYAWTEPWGPFVINGFGKLIPLFKDMFTELEDFFEKLAQHLAPKTQ